MRLDRVTRTVRRIHLLVPQRLGTQLAVVTAGCLLFVTLVSGWWFGQQRSSAAAQAQEQSIRKLAANIAAASPTHLFADDLASLEDTLVQFADVSDVLAVWVTDQEGRLLSEVVVSEGLPAPSYRAGQMDPPGQPRPRFQSSAGLHTAWHPIFAADQSGWAGVLSGSEGIRGLQREIWRSTVVTATVLFLVSSLGVWLFVRSRARALHEHAQFAATLDTHLGAQIPVVCSTREIEELGVAINRASRRLLRQENKIQEQTQRLSAILAHAAEGILVFSAEGTIESANPAAESLFGLSEAFMLGRAMEIFVPELTRILARPASAPGGRGRTRTEWEAEGLRADGSRFPLQLSLGSMGEGGRYVAIVQDITERERARAALEAANQQLEDRVLERTRQLESAQDELLRQQRMATLGQLTATVSHELRNPLGVLATSVHTLRRLMLPRAPEAKNNIERMERTIQRCTRIIEELLDFTRAQQLHDQSINLDSWLAELLAEQAHRPGVTAKSEPGLGRVEVRFDPDRLGRAIINVFENARQAVSGNPARPDLATPGLVTVSTRIGARGVEIRITDDGPGISPEIQARIFEPLFSTKGFGVGLGLPVVQKIMEQHEGGIELTSAPGRGTEVCLWLPAERIVRASAKEAG